MKRPTLRDIAAVAGVSHVTVSLALRNHPSISKKTCERIAKIAEEMGYKPDPALSALMYYRWGVRNVKYQATIAWINFGRTPLKDDGFNYQIFQGAQKRCDELGYMLEEFRLVDMGMNFKRLSEVLYSRNIQGVLLGTQARKIGHISTKTFAWNQFSVLTFGFSLISPKLDVVIDAQYRTGRLVVRKLKSLGYRRIGYVSTKAFDERTDSNFLAGYLAEQMRFPEANRIPPLIMTDGRDDFGQRCREWYRRHKPDAVFDAIGNFKGVLSPEERSHCGIALHNLQANTDPFYAGVVQNIDLIGRVGVDEVVAMIHANRRGIPLLARRITVEGMWRDGESAPRVNSRKP